MNDPAIRRRFGRALTNVFMYSILIGISLFMMLPFFWMLSTSLKPAEEIFHIPPIIISKNFSFASYLELFKHRNILRVLGNTILISTLATTLNLFFSSMAGFGFAKYKFPGKNSLFAFLLATFIVPFTVTMVPLFVMMNRMHWVDTIWPLVVPGAASAFGIFFMRQYISSINDELLDAARMDGASEFLIYWRIILPIVAPGLTSLGLIFFMASWNSFIWPLVILKSPQNFTLPIAINSYVAGTIGRPVYNLQMAASIISILPLLVIFLIFQRRYFEGITAGAIKS
ncbi:MAG TPA: carbohydrate ABC transporter permease [Anaerolineales bacterium]